MKDASVETLSKELIGRLAGRRVKDRVAAAVQLGEFFLLGSLPPNYILRPIAIALLEALRGERSKFVRGEILNSLVQAGRSSAIEDIDMEPLIAALAGRRADEVIAGLQILGATHNPRYRKVVEGYVGSRDSEIREAAHEALVEIDGNV